MKLMGNMIWLVLAGIWLWLHWIFWGVLWCVTIIGIPVGRQCFKLAGLSLWPFGKEVSFGGMGVGSFLLNILWLIFGGIEIAVGALIPGIIFCITIIGIPFGLQCFKIAKLALLPFGAEVIN